MKKRLLILAIAFIISSPLEALTLETVDNEFKPQSAAELGRMVGLEFMTPIVIGDSESVKAGKIPLAGTLPVTYGQLVPPANTPPVPPPAQRKILPQEDFDAFFFLQTDQYPYKTILFEKIFEQGASNRYKYLPSELRLVYTAPPAIEAEPAVHKKNTKVPQANKPRKQEHKDNKRAGQPGRRSHGKLW